MLIDWENTGYISVCPAPEYTPIEDNNTYIPTSTWGFIRGDISEQSDLMELLANIEGGLTAEQISLLVNADDRLDSVERDIAALETSHELDITHITTELNNKANADSVYTKEQIDSKGYLTEHQSLAGYATENWVYQRGYISAETDPIWSSEKHKYALKSELPSVAGLAKESWVNEQLTAKANIADVYTKSEIDGKNYLTEHQSLANYYTKSEVDGIIGDIEVDVDLTGYATENWVKQQNYLTEHQSLSDYYTKSEIVDIINDIEVDVDMTGYATEEWVSKQGYLTEHQSLANYYTKSEIVDIINDIEVDVDLTGIATEEWVFKQGYLTEHQSLANYYTKSEVDAAIENIDVDLTGYATETYVDTAVESKVDYSDIWTGTQEDWDALSVEQQNSYTIAMIEI